MIRFDAARQRVIDACHPLPSEQVAVAAALTRVLAQGIVSAADLSPFDNTAMDGFAQATAGKVLPARCARARTDMRAQHPATPMRIRMTEPGGYR